MKGLDQFFTKPEVAEKSYAYLCANIEKITGKPAGELFFIEPSAGCGNFYDLLPPRRRKGLDLAPQGAGIIKQNFLRWDYAPKAGRRKDTIVIGNPPFGHRAKMAIEFFNKAAEIADTIAFILPVQFRKYSVHKNLYPDFRWLSKQPLPIDSFYTPEGTIYKVRTEFQIWTRIKTPHKNKRLLRPPPIAHPDFEMWQYNNTPEALKVFTKKFDFAVPRQGYEDYSRRERCPARCERNKQWILFRATNAQVKTKLINMDFHKLSQNNTTIPGFGKADVVSVYKKAS